MNKYWHVSSYYLQDAVRDYAEKLLEYFKDDKHLSVRNNENESYEKFESRLGLLVCE
jgi:hypothetical protein